MFREWDPFDEMERLQRRMNALMRRMSEPFRGQWGNLREGWLHDSFPVDMKESEDELILTADLPGFEKDDIRIHVTADAIDIVAQRKREKKEVTERMYRHERSAGAMRRFMNLPVRVDPENVSAEFKNGVLTVRVKKKEVKKGKEIKVR